MTTMIANPERGNGRRCPCKSLLHGPRGCQEEQVTHPEGIESSCETCAPYEAVGMHLRPVFHPDPHAVASRHVIRTLDQTRPGIGWVTVCWADGIRVHPRRGGGHYHDPSEMEAVTLARAIA